jgi:hypothetical protein
LELASLLSSSDYKPSSKPFTGFQDRSDYFTFITSELSVPVGQLLAKVLVFKRFSSRTGLKFPATLLPLQGLH